MPRRDCLAVKQNHWQWQQHLRENVLWAWRWPSDQEWTAQQWQTMTAGRLLHTHDSRCQSDFCQITERLVWRMTYCMAGFKPDTWTSLQNEHTQSKKWDSGWRMAASERLIGQWKETVCDWDCLYFWQCGNVFILKDYRFVTKVIIKTWVL